MNLSVMVMLLSHKRNRNNTAQTTGIAGGSSCYTPSASSSTDMQFIEFKTSNQIDSTVLSRNEFDL